MIKHLKELIDNAEFCVEGIFNEFLIIPTHEKYNGFWGKNGYENMIVLARHFESDTWYRISQEQCDVFNIIGVRSVGIDIPDDVGCIRISSNEAIEISYPASAILGYKEQSND